MIHFTAIALLVIFFAAGVSGQPAANDPHIGFVYPAGGKQGTHFQAVVGGQRLGGVSRLLTSTPGVTATVKYNVRIVRNLDRDQRQEFNQRVRARREELRNTTRPANRRETRKAANAAARGAAKTAAKNDAGSTRTTLAMLNQPIFDNIEKLSLEELDFLEELYARDNRRQLNQQLAERIILDVRIVPNARVGECELRLLAGGGLTNPLRFQIGSQPEFIEKEPSQTPNAVRRTRLTTETFPIPAIFNGQIFPGDVDRFRFSARANQRLSIRVHARSLIPYLADAVPGWFQSTLAVYDARNREIAFADDNHFDPDPALLFKAPETGEYEIEIRDAIYRGREDFVYRIAVSDPMDSRPKRSPDADLPSAESIPSLDEIEPNNNLQDAQSVSMPHVVTGRIVSPRDLDIFKIKGRAGDRLIAEVMARRLNSPLDALLKITGASGRTLAINDDCEDAGSGLLTHHADPRLAFTFPNDGEYYVQLADTQQHGGPAYSYRLRLSAPRPDFELRVTPSSINVPAGRAFPLEVHALRRDGFKDPIDIEFKDKPFGFALAGARIPAGCDRIRMTLQAPQRATSEPLALRLEGRARIDNQIVVREAVPADDMMQAFIYHHLVPAQQLLVRVAGSRGRALLTPAANSHLDLPPGGSAEIVLHAARNQQLGGLKLELNNPPEGLSVKSTRPTQDGLILEVAADPEKTKPGLAGNLIIEIFNDRPAAQKNKKGAAQNQRISSGIIPAIPFQITPSASTRQTGNRP